MRKLQFSIRNTILGIKTKYTQEWNESKEKIINKDELSTRTN